jgi:hypothetical protein
MATKGIDNRQEAERVIGAIVGSTASGRESDSITGALIGIGYALLAIHDELRAARDKPESKGPTPKATIHNVRI